MQSYGAAREGSGWRHAGASGDVLEAFYYGRAFAEVLGERVSAATTEVLSELGKMDAERRQASRFASHNC